MTKGTALKVGAFALLWVNILLVRMGIDPLPVLDETNTALVGTFIISLYTLISKQFFGTKGKAQKKVLERTDLDDKMIK
jgi:hypothetical protein